jgi:hypothetical protein
MLSGLLAIFMSLVSRHSPDRGIRNGKKSGLVISPAGIAPAQRILQGQLKWNELRGVPGKGGSARIGDPINFAASVY